MVEDIHVNNESFLAGSKGRRAMDPQLTLVEFTLLVLCLITGCQVSRRDEIPWFSLTFPDYDKILTCAQDHLGESGSMQPRKFSKLGCSGWLKMSFTQQSSLTFPWLFLLFWKFPDFSLTFSPCIEVPCHFQVFQVAGHPVIIFYHSPHPYEFRRKFQTL